MARPRLIGKTYHQRPYYVNRIVPPIPAIFLYKQESGSKYSYNILDGKQRLESLLLFIGNQRDDLKVPKVLDYFFTPKDRAAVHFWTDLGDKRKVTFEELDDGVVRDFREYAIPTIEITLSDESSLDEIIDLFIDINQQGEPVTRFDIVKAMGKNPLLQSVFNLIAIKQKRRKDIVYKIQRSDFSKALERLQIVEGLSANAKVDRMWERLLEIVLFSRTKKHRAPVQILRSFIGGEEDKSRLSGAEITKLRRVFSFLSRAYSHSDLGETAFAKDQTHFYTMVTALIATDALEPQDGNNPDADALMNRLTTLGKS